MASIAIIVFLFSCIVGFFMVVGFIFRSMCLVISPMKTAAVPVMLLIMPVA